MATDAPSPDNRDDLVAQFEAALSGHGEAAPARERDTLDDVARKREQQREGVLGDRRIAIVRHIGDGDPAFPAGGQVDMIVSRRTGRYELQIGQPVNDAGVEAGGHEGTDHLRILKAVDRRNIERDCRAADIVLAHQRCTGLLFPILRLEQSNPHPRAFSTVSSSLNPDPTTLSTTMRTTSSSACEGIAPPTRTLPPSTWSSG